MKAFEPDYATAGGNGLCFQLDQYTTVGDMNWAAGSCHAGLSGRRDIDEEIWRPSSFWTGTSPGNL
jgi:hypothetical protein